MSRVSYYYYNQLKSRNKSTYDEILKGILGVNRSFRVSETNGETLSYVMQMITADHPEIFWWRGGCQYTIYGTYTICEPEYSCGKQNIIARQREIERVEASFLRKVRFGMSDYDKIKLVFDYIVETVEYVSNADDQTICGSLLLGRCVCAGYARGVQYLLQNLGIECLYVPGVSRDKGRHAWNIVKCNGRYYQLDATFGDRTFSSGRQDNYPKELEKNYAYLCTTDERMYADRQPNMPCALPRCSSDDLNYFKRVGTFYPYYSQKVLDDLRNAIYSGKRVWECQFENHADYRRMLQAIENDAFADIVGEYFQKIGRSGSYMTWNTEKDEMCNIACWY